MKVEKRGVSAVVASVLMILMVMVLVSVVYIWAKSFIESETGDAGDEVLCDSVNFDVVLVGKDGIDVYSYEVVNRGSVDIDSLKFEVSSSGDTELVDSDVEILAGDSVVGNVVLGGDVDGLEVKAVLGSGSGEVVCSSGSVSLFDFGDDDVSSSLTCFNADYVDLCDLLDFVFGSGYKEGCCIEHSFCC